MQIDRRRVEQDAPQRWKRGSTGLNAGLKAGEYQMDNLAAGAHKFKVCGVNSRGTGKASAVWTFTVPLAGAA